MLGYSYDVGRGVAKSRRQALRWYRRAAGMGESSGAHNIGTICRDRGDIARALHWFRRAVAMGDSESNLEVGKLLLGRLGRPVDALACFRSVGPRHGVSEADEESANVWAALAEGMIATQTKKGHGALP